MNTLHFTPNFNASRMNFNEVLETASNHIKSLSDAMQRSLKKDLENRLANPVSTN